MDDLIGVAILAGLGLFSLFLGILHLRGYGLKGEYMTDTIYTGRNYIPIPLGIAFLFFALAAPFSPSSTIGLVAAYIAAAFAILGLLSAFTQPSFLKPAWLKWLEAEHGEIMPLLRQEVKTMGYKTWNKQMKTQADMEKWVAEVRAKHGL